jgi:hypothetical protein
MPTIACNQIIRLTGLALYQTGTKNGNTKISSYEPGLSGYKSLNLLETKRSKLWIYKRPK